LSQQNINSDDLIEFAKILGKQTDFQNVLQLVAHKSAQFLKADLALVLMINPDTRKTVKTIIKDGKSIEQQAYRNIHIHVGGWIVNNNQPFLSHHIQKDDRFVKGLFDEVPLKSVAGVPLIVEGIVIGTLMLLYKNDLEKSNSSLINMLDKISTVSAPFLRNTQKIRQFFYSAAPETVLLLKYKNAGLFGRSPKFVELLHSIEAASKCDVRVLLDGQTGTGKELIAKAIHDFSSRSNFPFIAIDCGAIPNTLLESEFFGHKRGAFTGANSERQGLFLQASGGTLFMDEINNLPYEMQSKLLRILQEGEVRPIGSDKTFKTDVRIIAASSTSLKKLVDDNLFREDLYFRLHVYPIYIPDLIEREEDITLLANYFLDQYAKQQNKKTKKFHEEVIDFMKQRIWKGNVRELENFVERLITLATKDLSIIGVESFPNDLREELNQFREKRKIQATSESLKKKINQYEADIIKQTLTKCNWNKSEAARRLGTSEKNIRYKIETLNIKKSEIE
jgi:Nif-specific regulatory protein